MRSKDIYPHPGWVAWSVMLLLALTGCGGSKRVVKESGAEYRHLSKKQLIELYSEREPYSTIDARGRVGIYLSNKERELNLQGIGMRWHLEQGRGFELSVRPLAFMEAGRLTVAGDTVLAIDRLNKQYYLQPDAGRELRRLLPMVGVSPMMLEAIFQNEPFSFVERGNSALGRMAMQRTQEGYTFYTELRPGGNSILLTFDTHLNLCSTLLKLPGEGELLVTYSRFVTLGGGGAKRPTPGLIQIELKGEGKREPEALLHFRLEQMQEGEAYKWNTLPPRGYGQVTGADIYRMLKEL